MKEIYQLLDEREHVLKRSARYIGSPKPEEQLAWVFDDDKNKFVYKEVLVNKGLIKLFDEIISNSIDEHYRNPKRLNQIKIEFNLKENQISVWDNGGIPVRKHQDIDIYIPELIFSQLRSGSNFDDDEDRVGAGTHGEGSVLVNIFSDFFQVETCDGTKKFKQLFTDNMGEKTVAKIDNAKRNFTKITFKPDLKRFGLKSLSQIIDMLRMRVYEASACNPKIKFELKINSKKDSVKIQNFKQFIEFFTDEYFTHKQEGWDIGIAPSDNSYQHISFVNSTRTYDGGTHVDMVMWKIIDELRSYVEKKTKINITPGQIRNHIQLFINSTVYNPEWSSQTKEKMVSKKDSFLSELELPQSLIKKIMKSEIMASIMDWVEKKKIADEKRELRKINKKTSGRIEKLIDAKSKDRSKCRLYIFEGNSAISATRKLRDPKTLGAYPLRGKVLNAYKTTLQQLSKNNEVINLMSAIGLEIGKKPKDLRYDKICICTDADVDGTSITGLLITFFAKFWPELFEQNKIIRILTPLYIAKKGKNKKAFYNQKEYDSWIKKQKTIIGWEIQQKKGLAALEDEEYSNMLNNPVEQIITLDPDYKKSLEAWFGKNSNERKKRLKK